MPSEALCLCPPLFSCALVSRLPTHDVCNCLTYCYALHSGDRPVTPLSIVAHSNQRSEAASAVTTDNVVAPTDDASGSLTDEHALLLLLRECGTWWKIYAKRTGVAWSFLVPSDDEVLDTATRGLVLPKQHKVCCWLCYLEHNGTLHSNYPIRPDSQEGQERNIDEAIDCLHQANYFGESIDRSNIMTFEYKFSSGSSNLRNHASKHHGKWFAMLQSTEGPDSGSTKSKKTTSSNFLSSMFKPVKRLKDEEPRQKLFVEMLTFVIVFLRWSFSVVDNPWFRAFVWFLDGTVSIPTRKQWQGKHLAQAVKTTHKSIKDSLQGVEGVSVMFDLWMSRKGEHCPGTVCFYCFGSNTIVCSSGEDVLSLDIAYIDNAWTYQVRNIGIIHCKEGTSGEQVAKYVLPALEHHGLVGKVYAYVKDQGSNLKTTAQALSNTFTSGDSRVSCRAIGLPKPYNGKPALHMSFPPPC